jgi:hypothetical protein
MPEVWEQEGHLCAGPFLRGDIQEELAASPRGSGPPPQNSKDSQKCPPERIGRLAGDNCEYDADDDTNQRHEVPHTQGHLLPLL